MNTGIIGGVDGPTSIAYTVKYGPLFLTKVIIAIILVIAVMGFIVWRKTSGKR